MANIEDGNLISPEALQAALSIDEDKVVVPLTLARADVNRVKAVKVTDAELTKIQNFQDYLYDRGYLRDNTFASLFIYLFNLGFTLHKRIAEDEAKKEGK